MFCFHQFLKEGSCRQLWGAKTDVCSHGRELKQPSYWQRSKANIGSGLTFSQRISPMIDWLCTVALLILIDLISLVLVMIRSFQLMKRIETSCLLNRLAARIGRMKTWGGAWNSSLENIYNFSYRENVTADSIIAIEIIWKRRRSRKLKKLLVSLLLSSTFVIFIYATTLRLKNKIALPPHTPVWDCLNRSPPSGRALQSISLSSSPLRALPLKNQKERSHREDLKID